MPGVEVQVAPGYCLAFGGTNAREASCADGDIMGFNSVRTPTEPDLFFSWMARKLLDASHAGNAWLVAGFPGPVSPDGTIVGPLENVSGMRKEEYDLRRRLTAADPEVERVLEQGFVLLAVNDGTLAAQAAADRIGEHKFGKTGVLIFGTGVGAGVVKKDPRYANVHRADTENPFELGHQMLSGNPGDTLETRYSGPGIKRRFGFDPRYLPATHPAWKEQGEVIAAQAVALGVMNSVGLVVPTGGVGAGASDKYAPHLSRVMGLIPTHGSAPQRKFAPVVRLVPPKETDSFEMSGAEGVMRDYQAAS